MWSNGFRGESSPETRMDYYSYGNVICTMNPRANTTTIAYDGSQTFAISVSNPLSHVISTIYYGVNGVAMNMGVYGQISNVPDPNGSWTITANNSFGTVDTQHVFTSTLLSLSTWPYFDGLGRTMKIRSTDPDSKVALFEIRYDNRGATPTAQCLCGS